jgi:hypothetical protein
MGRGGGPGNFHETKGAPTQEESPKVPNVTYPGNDPTVPPGEGFEWRGKSPEGGDKGAWYNPDTGESWHPDLEHSEPIGPHWDYTDENGNKWRVFEDGRIESD